MKGLEKNVKVGILFISSWMIGQGTFILDGNVEDSATAEISRFQVWQWIQHAIQLDLDDNEDHQNALCTIFTILLTFLGKFCNAHRLHASGVNYSDMVLGPNFESERSYATFGTLFKI